MKMKFKRIGTLLNADHQFNVDSPPTQHSSFFILQQRWQEIVGEMISLNGKPIKIHNKELVILTKHPLFSQNISFMESMIIEKIFNSIPSLKGLFRSLKFQCNPDLFDKLSRTDLQPTPDQNLNKIHHESPEYKRLQKEASDLLSDITDLELKNSLIDLYISSNANKS